jgi:malate synthase
MSDVTIHGGLTIATVLYDLVNDEILAGTNITPADFWNGFDQAAHQLAPKNQALLETRARLQNQINDWLKAHSDDGIDPVAYESFLSDIGYLHADGGDFDIETSNVDPEIATIAGPQLVVPITNARYSLNAANARWGSLYDALYGTDAISDADGAEKTNSYNPVRGNKVIAFARDLLNKSAPLAKGSWNDVTGFAIADGSLVVAMGDGHTGLGDHDQFVGYTGKADSPSSII